MAAIPEPLRGWSTANNVEAEHFPSDGLSVANYRFAFIGRTSTADLQDPTLSIPRQYSSCEIAMPPGAALVASFYDIESGRKDLAMRGYSDAHEQFDIPVLRDGGIQDLLEEAQRPDRRFDYVICESIERIARRIYTGTKIEYLLEQLGVRLLAADEPFTLTHTSHHRKPKVATQVLTRRVKQSIAEFYVLEMLEKSWDGFAVHTEAGFNIGKPCYGYQARPVAHPVPAKRAKGHKKSLLEPHPAQAPVVGRIYASRCVERLTYQQIADRLNLDLVSNPPPVPVNPDTAVGRWTWSNVREVLTNPKYTGHMVWNRHGRKSNKNRLNPVSEWVWSQEPVHQALVGMDDFLLAQGIGSAHKGSRSTAEPNVHPDTKRTYWFRSHLLCDHCDRRMFGKTRRVAAYYVCQPKKGYAPEGHPNGGSFFVREQSLLDHLGTFLNQNVFGEYRRALLDADNPDARSETLRQQKLSALRAQIADVETKMKRLVHSLEVLDDPDREFVAEIQQRRVELNTERSQLREKLEAVETEIAQATNLNLIDALPTGVVDVEEMPYELARQLFDAFRLEVRYNKTHHRARYRVTITGHALRLANHIAHHAITRTTDVAAQSGGDAVERGMGTSTVPMHIVPPAGIEPAT